jgi:hypothetical protein
MYRFVSSTQHITIAAGTYLRVVPEDAVNRPCYPHRSGDERVDEFTEERPPDMPLGAVILLDGKPCYLVWADRSNSICRIDDRRYLTRHITLSELATHLTNLRSNVAYAAQDCIERQKVISTRHEIGRRRNLSAFVHRGMASARCAVLEEKG